MKIVQKTQSLCPICLRTLDAHYVEKGTHVYFEKSCPQHGFFSIPAWIHTPQAPTFTQWQQRGNTYATANTQRAQSQVTSSKNCPQNCGLCSEHQQQSCCVLLEITQACNMLCPVCYAATQNPASLQAHTQPSLAHIRSHLLALKKHAGNVNIQLSGGEPTLREDLPQIIQETHACGFNFVQLNSNGLRLGDETTGATYVQKLKDAGLNLVYLQWDAAGPASDAIYTTLRGGAYARIKERALQNCIEAQLPVLLVTTLVRGINDTCLQEILTAALKSGPLVRGIHLQPVASFGRYPWQQSEAPRLTIPEILHALETQSAGMLQATHFHPPQSEHPLCSFSAVYTRTLEHTLLPVHDTQGTCCTPAASDSLSNRSCDTLQSISQGTPCSPAKVACDFVARHWGAIPQTPSVLSSSAPYDDFDRFLEKTSLEQRFTVSGMAFQDVYSVDLARLRRCHIHILHDIQKDYPNLKPFCAYNMTSSTGFALHRRP